MKKQNRFLVFGIFGYPLAHTLSPRMHEAAFSHLKIKAFYLPFEIDPRDIQKTLRGLSPSMLQGFNLTVPFKETVLHYVDRLDDAAKKIGAVNTVYGQGGKWIGTNTDAFGFMMGLKKSARFKPLSKKVLVLGAGGSARSVVYALAVEKVKKITLVNRHLDRANKLIKTFQGHFRKVEFKAESLERAPWQTLVAEADLIVNTTSVGLRPHERSLIPDEAMLEAGSKPKLFYDLIYRPAETDFLKKAKDKGHSVMNGLEMLLYQGAKSFEFWTKRKAPLSVMKAALVEALQEK